VVYCPGSHAFFRHRRHPVERLLEAGINVALGTDSLASNNSLSMMKEMSRLREKHPAIPAEMVLYMATEAGAKALGIADRYGRLAEGMSASLVGVRGERVEVAYVNGQAT
jgi:cytosine/adenosine deaminase-related metal-dependent hydrolase